MYVAFGLLLGLLTAKWPIDIYSQLYENKSLLVDMNTSDPYCCPYRSPLTVCLEDSD